MTIETNVCNLGLSDIIAIQFEMSGQGSTVFSVELPNMTADHVCLEESIPAFNDLAGFSWLTQDGVVTVGGNRTVSSAGWSASGTLHFGIPINN